MADKQEINKERADSQRYYNLLMSKVGQIKNGDSILLVHIGNLDVIRKIVDNWPEGNYIIVDKKCYGPVLSLLYPSFQMEKQFIATQEDSSIIEALQSLTMKFDKIIMNPPYSKNLHLQILEEALKHLFQDGSCVNLSPDAWMTNPFRDFEKDSQKIKALKILGKYVQDLKSLTKDEFNALFGTSNFFGVGVFVFKLSPSSFDTEQFKSKNEILLKILKQIQRLSSLRNHYECRNDVKAKFQVSMRRTTHHNLSWYSDDANAKDKCSQVISFDSEIELKNFKGSLNSWLYRYLNVCEWDKGADCAYVPWMGDAINPRTGLKGYLSEWTDEDFYAYFNITEEEQKMIEDTLKKYR